MKTKNNMKYTENLTLNGYEPDAKFNKTEFERNGNIEKIRNLIKANLSKTKHVYRDAPSSYVLKHKAETILNTYITNGEFIYAMILEGYDVEKHRLNAYFNISKKSFKALRLLAKNIE